MKENNRIEFKRMLTDDLDVEKEVIAFLNYKDGGILYIGVSDDGIPIGVKDIDNDILKIKSRIRNNISPSPMGLFDVSIETIDFVNVIKVFVASGSEKPYYKTKFGMSTKGCFIRVGTAAEPMTTSMIEDLFAHRVRHSLRRIKSPRQDLTFRQLHIYYESKGLVLGNNFAKTLELLTDDGEYNYVAYLLADENGNSIKLAKYEGRDRCNLISNNEYGYCSLLKATDKLLDKLNIENTIVSHITYPYRIDQTLWDNEAIRELVINAIVHNDYTNEVPPKIEIFADRIEITSAGQLPEGMSEADFFDGISNPRNKELMRVFRDVEMVESLGSGIPRVLQKYSKECFVFMQNFIRIVLPFNIQTTIKTTIKTTTKNTTKNTAKNTTKNTTKNTLKTEEEILKIIQVNPSVTIDGLSELCHLSKDGIRYHIKALKVKGILIRQGGNKGGHWQIVNTIDTNIENKSK